MFIKEGFLKRMYQSWFTVRSLLFKRVNIFRTIYLYWLFRRFSSAWSKTFDFQLKIEQVKKAPDNSRIPRCPNAGQIHDGLLTMHNGIYIYADSYEGCGMASLLAANRGVHEPQEEFCFATILDCIAQRQIVRPSMVELGSNWAFYSLWFLNRFPNALYLLVEPDQVNLNAGKRNFALNHRQGTFIQAYIGKEKYSQVNPSISFSNLLNLAGGSPITILHADIQGFELNLLEETRPCLIKDKVDYLFISSHSNYLHYKCLQILRECGYRILAEADLLETFSTDGVIVAANNSLKEPKAICISKKTGA